jgi:hypothetical protein
MRADALYDPASQDLAEHFLADEPYTPSTANVHEARVKQLAAAIQSAVEAWLEDHPAGRR